MVALSHHIDVHGGPLSPSSGRRASNASISTVPSVAGRVQFSQRPFSLRSPLKVAPAAGARMSQADETTHGLLRKGSLMQRKVNALRLLSPFGAFFKEKELLDLARACSITSIRAGRELAESPFYVLISGVVTVKDTATDDILCKKHQGSFFTRRVGLGQISTVTHLAISTVLVGAQQGKVLMVSSSYLLGQFYGEVSTIGREAFLDICSSNIGEWAYSKGGDGSLENGGGQVILPRCIFRASACSVAFAAPMETLSRSAQPKYNPFMRSGLCTMRTIWNCNTSRQAGVYNTISGTP